MVVRFFLHIIKMKSRTYEILTNNVFTSKYRIYAFNMQFHIIILISSDSGCTFLKSVRNKLNSTLNAQVCGNGRLIVAMELCASVIF